MKFDNLGVDDLVKSQSKQPQIKALPVWYKGYRYRSRSEGRWAVFMDTIGIDFEYEPQGFKLEDGTCYLPDFRLPWCNMWAEVKPTDPTPEERRKCELTVLGTGGTFLYLAGTPDFRAYEGVSRDSGMLTEATYSLDIHRNFGPYFEGHRLWSSPEFEDLQEFTCSDRYRDAVYASRGARFDNKEYPKIGHEPFNPTEREMGGF
jgi:hypothetical protein